MRHVVNGAATVIAGVVLAGILVLATPKHTTVQKNGPILTPTPTKAVPTVTLTPTASPSATLTPRKTLYNRYYSVTPTLVPTHGPTK